MLFFDLLTIKQQEKTREFGNRVCCPARFLIIGQGDQANGMYIISSGIVESVFYTETDRELQLATWTENDFVGAPHLFGQATQQWSARALTDVELIHLGQSQLHCLLQDSPAIAVCLIQALGYKGQRYSELAQRLAFHTVQERLALVLLDVWDDTEQDNLCFDSLPMPSLLELSRAVGATRQAVGLAIKTLSTRGLINVEKGRYFLPSVQALKEYVIGESEQFSIAPLRST